MIEVEKRFIINSDQEAALVEGAEFVKLKDITDTYYDTSKYDLTLADKWLRLRDDQFELKLPVTFGLKTNREAEVYHELETEAEIREALDLPQEATLEQDLAQVGLQAFVNCRTIRKTYQKDDFHIDIDTVTYTGTDLTYAVTEIELMVENEAGVAEATERVVGLARQHGLIIDTATIGKVGFYIKNERPDHYKALVDGGVLPS